jgi:hypothetical protein
MDSTTVMQYTPLVNPIIEKEQFPIIPVVISFVVVLAVFAICILVYSKKRKH